ncbi:MAG TPA: DUF4258 domain-containing protein [Flavisolibacter sp.]|jgi:hypothetical protein|nr:DUF4258 domain-containing protein [Flavisolibacter sp.]
MNPKNVFFTLFLIIVILAIIISRIRHEPLSKELFDRHPAHLEYTHHALCRMECRHITKFDIDQIMQKGIINLNKTNRYDRPCPTFALQGFTSDGRDLRIIFAQCTGDTKVITCYNLKEDPVCHCPGDDLKNN